MQTSEKIEALKELGEWMEKYDIDTIMSYDDCILIPEINIKGWSNLDVNIINKRIKELEGE